MKEQEPKPTIIDELNKSLQDKALEDRDVPTVQSIAESMGISEKTLFDWLDTDIQFATELHQIRRLKEITDEMERKFPDLKWTDEEKKLLGEESLDLVTNEFLIFQVLVEARDRHYKPQNS